MVKVVINNNELNVPEGTTVLKAVRMAGYDVPALCSNENLEHINSCMLCFVKDEVSGRLFPSCSHVVKEEMKIITEDDELCKLRKTGLELILSEHTGDCEAPCKLGCPAHMNIPEMNRLIVNGNFVEAIKVVKRDIALPSVLGRICPAPCEGVCHRKSVDEAVSVCLLKRFVADMDDIHPWPLPPLNEKKVAIIGAGPAGLSAAYYLRLNGVNVTLYDKKNKPGGLLLTAIADDILPKDVLEREIASILKCGINFIGNTTVDSSKLNDLRNDFDALVLTAGSTNEIVNSYNLELTTNGLLVNPKTFETSSAGIFAVGSVVSPTRLAIRSLAHGKDVAFPVLQYINKREVTGKKQLFNSRFGKLMESEFTEYLKESTECKRVVTKFEYGYSEKQAIEEASRCLRCDCRAIDNCQLRNWSDFYLANQKRFQKSPRMAITKQFQTKGVVFEPGKCIKCGICVKMTEKFGEEYGLVFIGRGFDVKIGVPYGQTLDKGIEKAALQVARACPTGALEPGN